MGSHLRVARQLGPRLASILPCCCRIGVFTGGGEITDLVAMVQTKDVVSSPIQLRRLSEGSSLGLSSSRLDLGSAESDIVKRNLITDFWSATSLPVNVPLHRSIEAAEPPNSMRAEYGKCLNVREALALKLFSSSTTPECQKNDDKMTPVVTRRLGYSEMIFHIEM